MTRLQIKNLNSNIELVDKNLISKLYQKAKLIKDYEELNNILNSLVDLIGNLLVDKAYGDEVDYLNTKFSPNLHINITTARYIRFEDPEVETRMIAKFGDGVGVTLGDVSGNINESWGFRNNTTITEFNELGLFTNVTKITNGEYAFYQASNLQQIDLRNITEIGSSDSKAFLGCSNLTSVGNTSNLQIVGANAFKLCTSLTSIDLSNCTTINYGAFRGCTALTSVDISNMTSSSNSYDNGIFQNCTSLQNVVFPATLQDNTFMFAGCTNLGVNEDLDITLALYSRCMFLGTGYKSVTLHCNNLNTNTWPSGSNDGAFNSMPNVTKLDFSDTTMPHYPLSNNTNLTTLILPTTYSTVFWNTFSGSNNLLYIVILATTPPTLSNTEYMLNGNYHRNANVYVPDAVLTDYQTASGWSNISTRIKGISELPSSVTWYTKEHPTT